MTEPKRTKAEERRYTELLIETIDMNRELRDAHLKGLIIPADWHDIAKETPKPKRDKITLMIDRDVVKWFRGLGPGYQAKINRVLRTFMLGVVSKELEGAFDRDWKGDPL